MRLSDLVWMLSDPVGQEFSRGETWSKHLDFVLCDRTTLEPIIAIELDDSSHDKYDHKEADAVKDRVCDDAGLPLLRVKVVGIYEVESISAQIRVLIAQSTEGIADTDDLTDPDPVEH